MTERDGPGHGDEGGPRPSGRGAVTERLARRGQGAHEIDLTDDATRDRPADQPDRESSGAFEPAAPAAPTGDPPAEATRGGGASIFDVDERAKQEELNRTGYEPPVADPDADPDAPRGETTVTEPGEPRKEPQEAPQPTAETPAAAPAAATPAAADTPDSLLGSLDAAEVRSRFLDIQAGFIDEPRQAVEEAGRFVDDLVRQVADALHRQRGQLAGATDDASTEDLRLALRAYRQFVDRLLGLAD
jgi:hypothetical protein